MMARDGFNKRVPQQRDVAATTTLPTNIGAGAATASVGTGIVTASSNPVLTVITTSVVIISSPTGTEIPTPETVATTISITDSASYAALTASTSAFPTKTSKVSTSATSGATKSSTTASSKSSSNLGTIIPAVVVPIVIILLATFALFWFFMRRRHRRELKSTDFVMAGKGEKLGSRSNSSRSGTAGTYTAEKPTPMVAISEAKPTTFRSGPKISLNDIGVARPLTPKDSDTPGSRPRSPRRQHGQYQNFSGPRPSTARDHPQSRSNEPQNRNRSNSSPGNRGPPLPNGYGRDPYRPGGPPPRSGPSPVPRSAPSPVSRSGPSPTMGSSQRSLPMTPRPAPAPPGPAANRMRDASPSTNMGMNNRAPAPPALVAPPTGAYNGASSISQYSPIVKDTPNVAAAATFTPPSVPKTKFKPTDGPAPAPIQTRNLTSAERSPSPASPTGFLTEENMRIARLANSSRLGFFNTSATSPSAEHALNKPFQSQQAAVTSPTSATNPSPKLPPPATRSQLIPNDSPRDDKKVNYFSNASKHNSTTSSHYPRTIRKSMKHHDDDDANSVISDLDAYEDIDAKSDISSLNEFERFDFESTNEDRAESAHGSMIGSTRGGTGMGMGAAFRH